MKPRDPLCTPPSPLRPVYVLFHPDDSPAELPVLERCMGRLWPAASPIAPATLETLSRGALHDAGHALRLLHSIVDQDECVRCEAEVLGRRLLRKDQRWVEVWRRVREIALPENGASLPETSDWQDGALLRFVFLFLVEDESTRGALAVLGNQLVVETFARDVGNRLSPVPWEVAQLWAAFEDLREACRVLELVAREGEARETEGASRLEEPIRARLELLPDLLEVDDLGTRVFERLVSEGMLPEEALEALARKASGGKENQP